MSKYLFIFEDGQVMKADKVTDDEFVSCDNGILDVIDISGDEPMQYLNDGWHELPTAPPLYEKNDDYDGQPDEFTELQDFAQDGDFENMSASEVL